MLVPERRHHLLEQVRRHGSVRVEQLAEALGVSPSTVRRDLAQLERDGELRRARGGAVAPSLPAHALDTVQAGDAGVKDRIGRAAAAALADAATVMVLAGSTTQALVPYLARRRMTVVTNGLEIANALKHAPEVSLVVVGGYLHREQMTLLGPLTEQTMGELHVDVIVAGAWGVHPEIGVTGNKIVQAGYHHSMLRHTDALMVVADATKLGRRGPTVLAETAMVDTLITDTGAAADVVGALREHGVAVELA